MSPGLQNFHNLCIVYGSAQVILLSAMHLFNLLRSHVMSAAVRASDLMNILSIVQDQQVQSRCTCAFSLLERMNIHDSCCHGRMHWAILTQDSHICFWFMRLAQEIYLHLLIFFRYYLIMCWILSVPANSFTKEASGS